MAPFFRKKSLMEKLQSELATLRARAQTLHSRHSAAEAAFVDAEAKLQRHLLEADLDAGEKVRTKLETAVASCALTGNNFAKAITAQQAKIAEAEAKIAAEHDAIERDSAADKLARDLDEFEAALPDYLRAARHIADAADVVGHFHFESAELAAFTRNGQAQIEVAASFALAELRAMVEQIKTGAMPIPAPKLEPAPIPLAEPAAPTMTVFMLKSARYRDHDGRKRFAGQFEDAITPVATAQKAIRLGLAVSTADPRRATLRGTRNSDYVADGIDVVDIDAAEERSAVPYIGPDANDPVMRVANFTQVDRSSEARAIKISVPRL
jgi:hypothetical protein